jgi:transposase
MRDKELYRRILGIEEPWEVQEVELDGVKGEVRVLLEHRGERRLQCPECGTPCPGYDARPRRWRHLDTCQYRTILVAQVPRVECPQHGVRQVRVPWGEPGSGFTALFEALVIDWLKEANITAVADQLGLGWEATAGIMSRAVRRGLERRELKLPRRIGVDEVSFQKRHEYITVVHDPGKGVVVHLADGRGRECLDTFYRSFPEEERTAVEAVTMDMWAAYIASTVDYIPGAETKIGFDKFHIAQHLSKAVDQVRRQENKVLLAEGDERLKGTKYLWLKHPDHFQQERWRGFEPLRTSTLRTARAWAIKTLAMELWRYRSRAWARKAWLRWYSWAIRSRLEPIKAVARMIKGHLEGILTAVVLGVTNARAEGLNAKIQWIKTSARGFRNRDRFRDAIYFHLGGLDLYPAALTR